MVIIWCFYYNESGDSSESVMMINMMVMMMMVMMRMMGMKMTMMTVMMVKLGPSGRRGRLAEGLHQVLHDCLAALLCPSVPDVIRFDQIKDGKHISPSIIR